MRVAKGTIDVQRTPHRLTVQVQDPEGPASARLVLVDEDGEPHVFGQTGLVDSKARDEHLRVAYAIDGQARLDLPAGTYEIYAVRSILDTVATATIEVPRDTQVTLDLDRAVSLPDRLLADLHVHTNQSRDALIPDLLRYQSLIAADLDVAIVTDHNKIIDPRPYLAYLQSRAPHPVHGLPGIEADMRKGHIEQGRRWDIGHFNAFPVQPHPTLALPPVSYRHVHRYIDAYRTRQRELPFDGTQDTVLLQLNHPRGIQFRPEEPPGRSAWPMLQSLRYDPLRPSTSSLLRSPAKPS